MLYYMGHITKEEFQESRPRNRYEQHVNNSKTYQPNGEREVARRKKQNGH